MSEKRDLNEEGIKKMPYHGVPLYEPEFLAMIELEELLGKPIPQYIDDKEHDDDYNDEFYCDEEGDYFHDIVRFGFYEKNGHIIKLVINKRKLEYLPESIGMCNKLTTLSLGENRLTFLPHTIGNLKNLMFLEVHGNNIKVLPSTMGDLENLEILWLSQNKLRDLPEDFKKLSNLDEISIIGNPKPFNLARTLPTKVLNILQEIGCSILDDEGITASDKVEM